MNRVDRTTECRFRRGIRLAVTGALLVCAAAPAGREAIGSAPPDPPRSVSFDHQHTEWTTFLKRYVKDGTVFYTGINQSGQEALSGYLRQLELVTPEQMGGWTEAQKLAFWINAYNAYTIRLIIDNYPVRSILTMGLLPGGAFRKNFIPLTRLRGKILSLNDIEHEILRKEFEEPRIHFAIVCASISCPALRSEAFAATDLERQLEEVARAFILDETKNRYDAGKRTLHLSSIFKWFREDFERDGQGLVDFVAPYFEPGIRTQLGSGQVRVRFLRYDWGLNGR